MSNSAQTNESKTFDFAAALYRIGDDRESLIEVIDMFLSDYPQALSRLRSAVQNLDAKETRAAAHYLKSALGNIGAMRSYDSAASLEKLAAADNLSSAKQGLDNLEVEIAAFLTEYDKFKQG